MSLLYSVQHIENLIGSRKFALTNGTFLISNISLAITDKREPMKSALKHPHLGTALPLHSFKDLIGSRRFITEPVKRFQTPWPCCSPSCTTYPACRWLPRIRRIPIQSSQPSPPCCCLLYTTYPTPHWRTPVTLTNEKFLQILTLLLSFKYHLSNTSLANTYYMDQ